jgi:large subunit ribosomal protein L22
MQVKATARYVRVAPNKARQVVAHIRGLGVDEARRVLQFSPKDVAEQILKTLNSAAANAEHNDDLDVDDLFVEAVTVDEGPTLKRYQPRAMGRAYRIRKRTSHITITLGVKELATVGASAPKAGKPAKAAKQTSGSSRPETGSRQDPTDAAPAAQPDTDADTTSDAADTGEKE